MAILRLSRLIGPGSEIWRRRVKSGTARTRTSSGRDARQRLHLAWARSGYSCESAAGRGGARDSKGSWALLRSLSICRRIRTTTRASVIAETIFISAPQEHSIGSTFAEQPSMRRGRTQAHENNCIGVGPGRRTGPRCRLAAGTYFIFETGGPMCGEYPWRIPSPRRPWRVALWDRRNLASLWPLLSSGCYRPHTNVEYVVRALGCAR